MPQTSRGKFDRLPRTAAGAGLNAAMVDVQDREMMKTIYLIKSFRDTVVFSPADIS